MRLLEANLGEEQAWTRVGDAYEVTKKPRGLDRSKFLAIPFAAMEAIPQGGRYAPYFSVRAPDEIPSGTYFECGDVLISKITPSFENGKQALVHKLGSPFGYTSTEIIPLRPSDRRESDPRLLFFYLLHPDIRRHVADRMEGSTGRRRVPENVLLDLLIPKFEFSEQTAIADALELVQQALEAERAGENLARELKRAAMRALFSQGLRQASQEETKIGLLPKGWNVVTLGSLGRVGNGSTPKKSVEEYWKGGTFPWLNSAKVYDRDVIAADQFVSETALQKCHLPQLEPGAILIAITGQGKTLGHCAILRMRATINQHLAYVTLDPKRADPSFIRGYLETQYAYLRQVGSGGGSTKGALTCGFLKTLAVPLPPTLEEQQEIVTVLDAIDRKINLHRQKQAVLDELFKALLHKLMSGDIRVADLDLSVLGISFERGLRGSGLCDTFK